MTGRSLPIVTPDRSCGDCTKCCEGYTVTTVLGEPVMPGRPCRFKGATGCSIYDQRPVDPCQVYKCGWLASEEFPLWMKPNEVHAIFSERLTPYGEPYWLLTEAGARLDVRVLNWIIGEYFRRDGRLNVQYQLDGGWYVLGSRTFIRFVQENVTVV